MSKEYPALMVSDSGWEAIDRGHGLSAERIAEVEQAMIGSPPEGWFTEVTEEYFDYVPRIKHCSRLTGWGCDNEGEWHGHWVEVQPNDHPETHFTVIRHTDVAPEPDDAGRQEPDDVWGGGGAMKCPECGRFLARPWSESSGYPDYDISWGGICKVHGEVSE